MKIGPITVLAAAAVIAVAAWPAYMSRQESASVGAAVPTAAPVFPDYATRNKMVAFYERRAGKDPGDPIMPRLLAQQYLQRYRETADIDDLSRAQHAAKMSLKAMPDANGVADRAMASALLAEHKFREAKTYLRVALGDRPDNPEIVASMAGLDFELGEYAEGKRLLDGLAEKERENAAVKTELARYDELTGKLAEAAPLLRSVTRLTDADFYMSAENRAWYHYRLGELAFESGDVENAIAQEQEALKAFPTYWHGYSSLAKFYWATKQWKLALETATKGADLNPLPETLGYKADAQRALGDAAGAKETDDTILAIERLGNALHVNDRLLAVYYADHGIRTGDAYAIAEREIKVRDDIYAEDTLAWAAAAAGHWNAARTAAQSATRWGTQDPRLQYHAGAIALHFGNKSEAKARFEAALALNPAFHPVYADQAREALKSL